MTRNSTNTANLLNILKSQDVGDEQKVLLIETVAGYDSGTCGYQTNIISSLLTELGEDDFEVTSQEDWDDLVKIILDAAAKNAAKNAATPAAQVPAKQQVMIIPSPPTAEPHRILLDRIPKGDSPEATKLRKDHLFLGIPRDVVSVGVIYRDENGNVLEPADAIKHLINKKLDEYTEMLAEANPTLSPRQLAALAARSAENWQKQAEDELADEIKVLKQSNALMARAVALGLADEYVAMLAANEAAARLKQYLKTRGLLPQTSPSSTTDMQRPRGRPRGRPGKEEAPATSFAAKVKQLADRVPQIVDLNGFITMQNSKGEKLLLNSKTGMFHLMDGTLPAQVDILPNGEKNNDPTGARVAAYAAHYQVTGVVGQFWFVVGLTLDEDGKFITLDERAWRNLPRVSQNEKSLDKLWMSQMRLAQFFALDK